MRLLLSPLLSVALGMACALAHAQPSDAPGAVHAATSSGPEAVILATHSASGQVPVKSWKTRRDARIVKQDLDYSCGAASLATLLNNFYGLDVCHIPDDHKAFDGIARGWI